MVYACTCMYFLLRFAPQCFLQLSRIPCLISRLPTVVQCGLVSQLCNAYVQEGPLFSKDSDTLMAHVIHSQWVLRFVFRHKHLPNLPARSGTPAPETNSNSLEQIDTTVS